MLKIAFNRCMNCGVEFGKLVQPHGLPKYCSDKCHNDRKLRLRKGAQTKYNAKKYRPPQPRNCVMCDKNYTPGGTRSDSRFCSLKCCMRGNQIERTYKISLSEYHSMVVEQAGHCAACLLPFNNETPHIDHDHSTGRVRGLTHSVCNSVLGFVKDDVTLLQNLINYLGDE